MRFQLIALFLVLTGLASGQDVYQDLPITEVTVFKDGHAFVLHHGALSPNTSGNVVMDHLPQPVIGTFWPYCPDKNAELKSVVAGEKEVMEEKDALNLKDFIKANLGANALIQENDDAPAYEARILESPFDKGEVALFKTATGTKVVEADQIKSLTIKGDHKSRLSHKKKKKLMALNLSWKDGTPRKKAEVGMAYLQKGLRWIPSYKVVIDGKGKANIILNATIVNELADLKDTDFHLVIGVPSFDFQDTLDPMALNETTALLSSHIQQDTQTAFAFSNAISSQFASPIQSRNTVSPASDMGPKIKGADAKEDLFVFTLKGLTLKKGERMTTTVTQFDLTYENAYVLNIPFSPPIEVRHNFNSSRMEELAKLFKQPKVEHRIRLLNNSPYPLTTAPALILKGKTVLAQGLMTYTPVGSKSDLKITAAINIEVMKEDKELSRTPDAIKINGYDYNRIDLEGTIQLTSFDDKPVEVEVSRSVLGKMDNASLDGKIKKMNILEDPAFVRGGYPFWWSWFSWPYWWYHINSMSRGSWTVKLEKNKPVSVYYTWHYFWR